MEQRPARLLLLGNPEITVLQLLQIWCEDEATVGEAEENWQNYLVSDRGKVQILDVRKFALANTTGACSLLSNVNKTPDAVVMLFPWTDRDIAQLEQCDAEIGRKCPMLIVQSQTTSHQDLASLSLVTRHREVRKIDLTPGAGAALCELLPNSAQLEMARILNAKDAQRHTANTILHSFAAVCGIIGMQPIPLADLPLLTSLQSFMVGTIAYCSGRRLKTKAIAEFLGAVGLNIGAGMLFREGARTAIRLLPFWGSAISGFIAGTGTYAIGKAAIAYFIDEIPLAAIRRKRK